MHNRYRKCGCRFRHRLFKNGAPMMTQIFAHILKKTTWTIYSIYGSPVCQSTCRLLWRHYINWASVDLHQIQSELELGQVGKVCGTREKQSIMLVIKCVSNNTKSVL